MKISRRHRGLQLALAAAACVVAPHFSRAADSSWIHAGNGNWSLGSNWLGGVPVSGSNVYITDNGALAPATITYDYTGASILFNSMLVEVVGGGSNLFSQSANTFNAVTEVIGNSGTGYWSLSGGTHNTTAAFASGLAFGSLVTGRGTGTLSGGTLNAGPGEVFLGYSGAGTLTQTNGLLSASYMTVGWQPSGTGTYNLNGGAVAINSAITVGWMGSGTLNMAGGTITSSFESVGGSTGSGQFIQTAGVNTAQTMYLAGTASGRGTYSLGGSGSLTVNGTEYVGNSGAGTFNHTGGAQLIAGSPAGNTGLYLGYLQNSVGSYSLSGSTSVLTVNATEHIGEAGTGSFTQNNGTNTIAGAGAPTDGFVLGAGATGIGSYTLNGGNFNVTAPAGMTVGGSGIGNFIQNGGMGIAGTPGAERDLNINANGGTTSSGIFTLTSNLGPSRFTVNGNSYVGGNSTSMGGSGVLNVNGGSMTVTGRIKLWNTGTVNLNGGTLAASTIELNNGGGSVNFASGTVNITGTAGFSVAPGQALGQALSLNGLKALVVSNTTTISGGSSVSLDGGTFATGSLANGGVFQFNSGTFRLTNSSFTVGAGGILGGAVQLNANQHLEVTGGASTVDPAALLYLTGGTVLGTSGITNNGQILLASPLSQVSGGMMTNNGIISGSGRIANDLTNGTGGIIRVSGAEWLQLTGTTNSNDGQINLISGGAVEFTRELTNGKFGLISGRGQLLTGGRGLDNSGNLALSGGFTDIHGNVTNRSSGKIVVSGQANVSFWNDVFNDSGGSIKVSPGSAATFFGAYSGDGITGGGDVYFESDLSPGFSPAAISVGGNVYLGPQSKLKIELGGKTRGTQYDAVDIGGAASLDGKVSVSTLGGFAPLPGDTFNILSFASRSGDVTVEAETPFAGLRFQKVYTATALQLLASALYDGDANLDGLVDIRDLYALASHYNTGGQIWTGGDFTHDGIVNAVDLGILASHWQAGVGSPGATLDAALASLGLPAAVVPEPASLTVVVSIAGGLSLLSARRRARSAHGSRWPQSSR